MIREALFLQPAVDAVIQIPGVDDRHPEIGHAEDHVQMELPARLEIIDDGPAVGNGGLFHAAALEHREDLGQAVLIGTNRTGSP